MSPTLSLKILEAHYKTPWNFLAETNADGRSPEATASANQIWWGLINAIGTANQRVGKEKDDY